MLALYVPPVSARSSHGEAGAQFASDKLHDLRTCHAALTASCNGSKHLARASTWVRDMHRTRARHYLTEGEDMKIRTAIIATVAAGLSLAYAQGPRAGGAGQRGQGGGLNMSAIQTIEGVVTQVNIAYGVEYPSIVVNKQQVKVAPAWFLLNHDFEIKTGDSLRIKAAPSAVRNDGFFYAVEITKGTATIALRDDFGVPLWSGRGRGAQTRPFGTGQHGGCIDAASVATVTGTLEKANAGVGVQQPTLVLRLTDGTLLTVKIGPERILLDAGFELSAGDKLTVTYALASCTDEYVALELVNAAGETLVLRTADGTPAWN
jgi:hypothetical protein